MKKRLSTIMAIAATLSMIFIAGPVMASEVGEQTVSYGVSDINEIATAGTVGLSVETATAGSDPDQVGASSTYDITTNYAGASKSKITAVLSGEAVTGLTFGIHVTAPSTGTNVEAAELEAGVSRDVVTDIGPVAEAGLGIAYTLDATVLAVPATSVDKTLTLTIVNNI